jgi:hypothetical protein
MKENIGIHPGSFSYHAVLYTVSQKDETKTKRLIE